MAKINRNILTEEINHKIRDQELSASDWELWKLAWELHWWVDFFLIAFFKDEPVPIPVLTFESARINTLGHYRIGRNAFGVKEQININRKWLHRPLWETLSTLLHEMTHSWEYTHLPPEKRTNNWYHKKPFREKMLEFGILCSEKGCHVGIDPQGKFAHYLRLHCVELIVQPYGSDPDNNLIPIDPDKKKAKGKSKLKKWSCGCTNVRVAIQDFQAKCLKCGNEFELQD